MMESTRPTLLSRLRDPGDRAAWREFDERYHELVVRYCRRAGMQRADAEDVRQVVMMSMARAMGGFEYQPEKGRFRDFLGTVVRNAIRRHFSRQGRSPVELPGERTDTGEPSDDQWLRTWDEEWMLHHFRRAMVRIRQTFHAKSLVIFDELLAGRSGEELAREHGLTPEAVYKIKQRIRDRLRELIQQQLQEEDLPA